MNRLIYRLALASAALWTVYCAFDLWWVLGHVDEVLLPTLRALGVELNAPAELSAARVGFISAYQQSRLAWWVGITAVLLLVALAVRPRAER